MSGRGLLGLALLAFAGSLLGFLAYAHLALDLGLSNAPAALRFPPQLDVDVRTTRAVAIKLDGTISASAPVSQPLQVPLQGRYPVTAALTAKVPLDFVITYNGAIPVNSVADVNGTTDLIVHSRFLPSFPLHMALPLKFDVPVSLKVPVKTSIDVAYRGPLLIDFNQVVNTRLDTTLKTSLPVKQDMMAPVLASFGLRLQAPQTPVAAVIRHADLRLPIKSLAFSRNDAEQMAPAH
ncbi:MAG: hypothetical protein VW625_04345 [Perlucidibaca sp.]